MKVVSRGPPKRLVGAAVSLVRMVSGPKWELTVEVHHFGITVLEVRGKSSSLKKACWGCSLLSYLK